MNGDSPGFCSSCWRACCSRRAIGDLKARTIPNGLNIGHRAARDSLLVGERPSRSGRTWRCRSASPLVASLSSPAPSRWGAMGGGDVKLIGALALWLPWPALLLMLVIMSLAGGALTLAMMIRKKLARTEGPAGDSLWGRHRLRRIVDDWPTFFLPIWLMSETEVFHTQSGRRQPPWTLRNSRC